MSEAQRLAARIVTTWPGGPTVEVWVEELTQLDAGPAGTAYIRLRRELERAPTVARFLSAVRQVSARTEQPELTPRCLLCDGDGWVYVIDDRRHGPGCLAKLDPDRAAELGDCGCHAMERCACQRH